MSLDRTVDRISFGKHVEPKETRDRHYKREQRKKIRTITVRADLYNQIKAEAQKREKTLIKLAEEILEEWLQKNEKNVEKQA